MFIVLSYLPIIYAFMVTTNVNKPNSFGHWIEQPPNNYNSYGKWLNSTHHNYTGCITNKKLSFIGVPDFTPI
jgi:hypothetical protein